ncbi:DUF2079 domain-containing protein [Thermodesulfobacteriota bacterium]
MTRKQTIAVLFLVVGLYTVILSTLAIGHYRSFFSYEFEDAACYHQILWNAAHGRTLKPVASFSECEHEGFFPSIWLLLPFYRIRPEPTTLIVLQTLVFGLGAVPVFLLSRRWTRRSWLQIFFTSLYLLQPLLHYQNLNYFRPAMLAPTLLLFIVYFFSNSRPLPLALTSLAVIGLRPEFAAILGMLGVGALFSGQRRRWAVSLIVGSIVCYLLITQILMPHVYGFDYNASRFARQFSIEISMPDIADHGSFGGRIYNNLFHGDIGVWFRNCWGWQFLLFLISPYSLLAAPGILGIVKLTEETASIQNNELHYLTSIFPFVFIGTIHGFSWLIRRPKRTLPSTQSNNKFLIYGGCTFLSLGTLFQIVGDNIPGIVMAGRTPIEDDRFTDARNLYDPVYTTLDDADRAAWKFIRRIPQDASVAATGDLLWALSARRELYQFGYDREWLTDYVLINSRSLFIGAGTYCIIPPEQQAVLVQEYIETGLYELVDVEEGFTFLRNKYADGTVDVQ